jgi:hypothetical protein
MEDSRTASQTCTGQKDIRGKDGKRMKALYNRNENVLKGKGRWNTPRAQIMGSRKVEHSKDRVNIEGWAKEKTG